ncbi:hypothetical protein OROMI_013252 [Orobanche minor]
MYRCSIFTSSGLLRWVSRYFAELFIVATVYCSEQFGEFSSYIIVIAFLILHLPFSVISMVTFFSDEILLLLMARSLMYRTMASLDNAMELPTNCKGEASRSKRAVPKYHGERILLKRMETILTQAWSLPPVEACQICGAACYLRESKGFCCLRGQISLGLPRMPQQLWNWYISTDSTSAFHFRKSCRTYNNTTAFSSLGITYDRTLAQSNKGIYTLRIQGAVYHFIRSLIPPAGPGRQLQVYFFDTENELDNSLRELTNLQDYNIVLRAYPCLDMRIYNLPTTHQVAAIWNELTDIPADHPHDIRVCTSAGKTHRVHFYYGCYDPLQYPLLFPYGESGWHTDLDTNRWKRDNVAAREFYCYLFQSRDIDATNILRTGSEQLQHDLRVESFEGIVEIMACEGNTNGNKIGQKFVLPSSYIGSPRDMRWRYLNALALVSEYGKPNFFITMTCNPNWPEIREGLLPGDEAQNRSDLIARVFRARNEELKNELVKRKLLEKI